MIEAKELRKVYKTKGGVTVHALDKVSVKLPDTGMVFILGKSGSGKSTLLNVLGGLDNFDSGEIIIKGTSAREFRQSHYDSYRNTYIGFIFQEYNILDELTVGANVALAIELQGRKATDEEINSILKEVDLDGYGQRKPNELSGGQKQRVAIARALVKKPEIIMADEPTGALDSTTGKQVFDTLKKLSRDKLVLIVSHDREFSEQYADRIIELKDGKIISDVEKEAVNGDFDLSEDAETDDSLVYGDGEINIKPGYTLTEDDRLAINEYLKAYSEGAVLKVGSKLKKKFSAKDFKPTDESKIISNKKGDFKLIKSKLSIKNAFKLGSGALKYKKVRLVFTILLSLVSFTLFGLADTIAAYNSINTATNSIFDTGVNYASFSKVIKKSYDDYEYWSYDDNYITPEELDEIKNKTGKNLIGVYKGMTDNFSFSQNLGDGTVEGMAPSVIYTSSFSGVAAIKESDMTDYGFTCLAGVLPSGNKNEIVVSKYVYDYFSKVGHVAVNNENQEVKTEIKTYDDLIGKTINFGLVHNNNTEFKIVGIIDTNFNYSRYEALASTNAQFELSMIEIMALTEELNAARNYSFAAVGFLSIESMEAIIQNKLEQPEGLMNIGSVDIYLTTKDINSYDDLWNQDSGDANFDNSYSFSALYSLSKAQDKIIWFDKLDTLKENQIVVPMYIFQFLTSGEVRKPEVFDDPELLQDIEKELYERFTSGELWIESYPSLRNYFYIPKYFAALHYAMQNPDLAKAKYAEYSSIDISEIDTSNFYNSFALLVREEGAFSDVFTDSYIEEFKNGIINKYGLTEYLTPKATKDKLIAKFTYNGKEYYSYDPDYITFTFQYSDYYSLQDIIARKYAAENFLDAENFYKLKYKDNELALLNVSAEQIISTYTSYLTADGKSFISYAAPDGFVPTATKTFEDYSSESIVELGKANMKDSKIVLASRSYRGSGEKFITNVEIVGVMKSNKFLESAPVVADSVMEQIFSANLGGIYSYALGTMPGEKAEIKELVKFSKNYGNATDDVKYSLENNVMSQLNMVDEILDILGQVFLYVGIGFAVFASLMLMNFISTSISYKKQDIGILRAIGSRSADVFRIFFAESFIIAMTNYVLSIIGTLSITLVINNMLRNEAGLLITFLNFGIRQVGILLGVSLAVAFLATFLPVKKIASMKPIDAIKNRK